MARNRRGLCAKRRPIPRYSDTPCSAYSFLPAPATPGSSIRRRRHFPDEFLWADLYEPTTEEERAVEALLTVDVPTRDEMKEIETSNRLYEEGGALYMTATVGSKLDSDRPESSVITFILANGRMITNRYVDPTPVRRFMQFVERSPAACTSATTLLAGLVEAFVERIADLLERVQTELDHVSFAVFPRAGQTSPTQRKPARPDPADRRRRRPGLEGAREPRQLPSHADVPAAEREPRRCRRSSAAASGRS